MLTGEELLRKVNACLDSLPYNRKPEGLYAPIKYALSMGGKRIRPVLMMLAYNLYKDHPEDILMTACALETYHNYTLLHDDLMDNADLRRGHETVHRKWDANTAILSGDTMLVMAYERMMQCPQDKLADILRLFTETALEIGEGQQYDMEFEQRSDVREEEYIEMIRLKTSVLLACALKMGAILGDAPKDDTELLYDLGVKVGLAFQLQDDYLDVYGDPKVFGKAIGGDITSNKKTYMLIQAFAHANAEQRKELEKWCSGPADAPGKIAAVTKLYTEIGVDRMAQERMAEYFDQGLQCLDKLSVEPQRKTELEAYVKRMMHRQY